MHVLVIYTAVWGKIPRREQLVGYQGHKDHVQYLRMTGLPPSIVIPFPRERCRCHGVVDKVLVKLGGPLLSIDVKILGAQR